MYDRPEEADGRAPNRAPPELVVKIKGEPAAKDRAASASQKAANGGSLADVLARHGATLQPVMPEKTAAKDASASASEGSPAAELAAYYTVAAPEDGMDALQEALMADDAVESAYIKPPAEEPVALAERAHDIINEMMPITDRAPASTPDFTASQIYLNPAPEGIDARYAWTLAGGKGDGVTIIDCEWGWNFSHEDLGDKQIGVVFAANSANNDHGTAVLGEYSGDPNTFGVTGICSDAVAGASSFHRTPSTARTIREAADRLSAGDILLLEIHRPGPNATGSGQVGFIAVEWWPDDFAAIRYAVDKGIIVVEAAGNGGEDFDAAVYNTRPAGFPAGWKNPFDPANPTSGAVVVGAGAPPPGTHGRDHGPDRSRLGFSNYGRRVDCQGWGREVTTAGYGNLQGGSRDRWYTETFSGTSSASPIVVGALGCVQGILKAQGADLLTPQGAIDLLRRTGSPQQDAPGRPRSQRIGNRPDLRQMIPQAAKTWSNNVAVQRVFASYHSQNAWGLIEGLGWRKIAGGSPDGVTNMLAALTQCAASGQKADIYADGSSVYRVVQR